MAGVGTSAALWPLINQMQPDASVIAAGVPIDIDISQLEPGQQCEPYGVACSSSVVNRSQTALAGLQNPQLLAMLRDPQSNQLQQLALHGELAPIDQALNFSSASASVPILSWPARIQAGRQRRWLRTAISARVTASNMISQAASFPAFPRPIICPCLPDRYVNDKVLRIGENPDGQTFDFGTIEQV